MMDRLWAQLMRVDARMAAGVVMTISVLVAVMAILQLGMTPSTVPLAPSPFLPAAGDVPETTPPSFDPPATADAMPATPFTSDYLVKRIEFEARERAEKERAEQEQAERERAEAERKKAEAEAAPAAEAPPVEEPKPEPTPPRILRLVYQGVMHRPDRTRIALVADATAGATVFVETGQAIDVFHVDTIQDRSLVLAGEGREPVTLPINQETTIEVPQP